MSDQTPPPPPPPPPTPGPYGGPPPQAGTPRPGELLDRFLARLVDGLILGIVFSILNAIFRGLFLNGFSFSTGEILVYWFFTSVLSVAASLAYYGFLESTRGATLGKQALKLKVVGPDGVSHPTMEQALRRNAFYAIQLAFIVPFVGPLLGGLGYLVAVILIAVGINGDTVRRQGWHDKFAGGTQVLKIG